MDIKELISEASKKSPNFKKKIDYWFLKRNIMPEEEWLLKELAEVFGKDYLLKVMQKKILEDSLSFKK